MIISINAETTFDKTYNSFINNTQKTMGRMKNFQTDKGHQHTPKADTTVNHERLHALHDWEQDEGVHFYSTSYSQS